VATAHLGGRLTGRAAIAAVGAIAVGLVIVALLILTGTPASPVGALASPTPTDAAPAASATAGEPATTAAPTPIPSPTPPAVVLVSGPLTGVPVTEAAARYHPIAVMVDDHIGARPQSGFNAADIVLQAPAEGGIPRYMLIFQDTIPASVGPIRSAREYFLEWAAGWNAMYVHHGGSPQALTTLRTYGFGQYVWNADGFRWSPTYLWRIATRPSPHNVYTDGTHLRELAHRIGVPDDAMTSQWRFAPESGADRPTGNTIVVRYPYETITFKYDPGRDAYLRYIDTSKTPQVDAADGQVVAPRNVVVVRMHFGPLIDSPTFKHRLEAADIGSGDAWISTGGRTIHGTWRKSAIDAPLQLFDAHGKPAVLQPGQTFVEVLALTYGYTITNGTLPTMDSDLRGAFTPS